MEREKNVMCFLPARMFYVFLKQLFFRTMVYPPFPSLGHFPDKLCFLRLPNTCN